MMSLQYFTDTEAAAIGGTNFNTGGPNLALDFAPVYIGYGNCQVCV